MSALVAYFLQLKQEELAHFIFDNLLNNSKTLSREKMEEELLNGGKCTYCCHIFEDECRSEWSDDHQQHYKSISCKGCGKKNWIRVNFQGSGHDNGVSFSPLESTVKKVRDK